MSQREERRTGGGSVREARQRAEAGVPFKLASPPRQAQYDQYRPNPAGNRARPQGPVGFTGARDAQGQIGVAISRPTQVPQWPLAGTTDSAQYQPPANRGPAPQRPPRPSVVLSMLDASRLQDPMPTFQYTPAQNPGQVKSNVYYEDTDPVSPTMPDILSPGTLSSRPSTVSSVGSIPDFPIPAIPQSLPIQGPRRSGNLGPPPLSRRGASSYYSQASFVSPIPEESPRESSAHRSYASSAAIPSNWSTHPESPMSPGFLNDDYYAYGGSEDGRISRGSTQDDSDDRGLIRSASIGKRAKPSVITTKSSEKLDSERSTTQMPRMGQAQTEKKEEVGKGQKANVSTEPSTVGNGQRQTFWPTVANADSPLANGTGLIDATPSTSAESVPTLKNLPNNKGHAPSNSNGKANTLLGAPIATAPSGLAPIAAPLASRTPSPGAPNRLSAMRRPPRLNIDAVREAEARGSLTSLPDLILRATRLASMMDRGKRPGSRLNDLNDFPMDIDLSSRNRDNSAANARMSTLSGMLASFPPPGIETPPASSHRPQSAWPAGYDATGSEKLDQSNQKQPRKTRRCCGMPCWLALLLHFILLLIIAAAIVVPVYFLVIKKNQQEPKLTALQMCEQDSTTSCQNGGMASVSTGSCSCICIGGFTGSTCQTRAEGACATTSFAMSSGSDGPVQVANATLGDAVVRLINGAQTNFSIPLDQSILISRFNSGSLSCVSQNALVTFDGRSTRSAAANSATSNNKPSTLSARTRKQRRQDNTPSQTTSASPSVGTASGGIIFDNGSVPSPTSSSSGSSTSSEPGSANNLNVGALFNVTQEDVDFSRVAVLYVLQEQALDQAIMAQSSLQKFIGSQSYTNGDARNITLGAGNSVNFLTWTIDVGRGSVGGRKIS